jgi:hypothetical protein
MECDRMQLVCRQHVLALTFFCRSRWAAIAVTESPETIPTNSAVHTNSETLVASPDHTKPHADSWSVRLGERREAYNQCLVVFKYL